jgi:hypothetical protein
MFHLLRVLLQGSRGIDGSRYEDPFVVMACGLAHLRFSEED